MIEEITIGVFGLLYSLITIYNICDWNSYIKQIKDDKE